MDTIARKLESLLSYINPNNSEKGENVIDLQKTFSSINIDLLPIVVKILELEAGFPTSKIITSEGNKYHELEFFTTNQDSSNSTENKSLFERLDKTQTLLGSNILKSIILKPYHSKEDIIEIVQNRQSVIMELSITNIKKIQNLIAKMAHIERDVLSMCLPDTPEMLEVYKIIFFEMTPLKYLNYHTGFLSIFYYFMIIFSPVYGMISPFIFIFAPFLFLKYVMKIPLPLDVFWNMIKKMLFGSSGLFSTLDKLLNSNVGDTMQTTFNNGGISFKGTIFWLAKMLVALLNSSIGSYAYIGFIVISYLYGIYNSFQVSITFNKIINMFHSRMNIIASWLRECQKMLVARICFNSKELQPIIARINAAMQMEVVQNLLQDDVFIKEPGVISNKGMIIKTFKMFLDSKESLQRVIEPFAQYVAYVDMFTALSSWLREDNTNNRCIAKFILESDHPILKGANIWNICCDKPIYNDIQLGIPITINKEQDKEKTVLTTPNIESTTTQEITSLENTEIINNYDKTDNEIDESNQESAENTEKIDLVKDKEEDGDNEEDGDKEEDGDNEEDGDKENLEATNSKNKEQVDKITEELVYNNIIITGPNGSGKSTYIKSIAECLILAQSIGIVPAREFQSTPFKHISTYLNIPDCQGKESLFQAEMNRCYNQLQVLETAESAEEFSFNIMDEIFVSTNYQEGMSGAYAVINQLCRFKKCLNIITTHFDTLANLTDLQVDKKYFDIDILEDGNVARDYKIRDGVSKKHMALKLLRNRGFSKEILDDAEKFYEKLTTQEVKP